MLNLNIIRRISAVLAVLCLVCAVAAKAEVTNYGSVIHHSDTSNVLYFISKIEPNDTFQVRKALRNHDIKTLVLASPGGSVWEALNIAGIIFDRKIDVIVPAGMKCASACAFMFFAGNQRLVNGELGVHQFFSTEKQPTKDTEARTQFTTSEIIGFLNEFGTPPFVFERMFQQQEIYWFDGDELLQLQTERSSSFEAETEVAEKTLKLLLDELTESVDDALAQAVANYMKLSRREKVKTVQEVLNSRSCPVGSADGVMGQKTKYGLQKAAAAGEFKYTEGLIDDENFINFLFREKTALCDYKIAAPSLGAAVKPARQPFFARYYTSCNGRALNEYITITFNPATNFGTYSMNGGTSTFRLSGTKMVWASPEPGVSNPNVWFNDKGMVILFTFSNRHCRSISMRPL